MKLLLLCVVDIKSAPDAPGRIPNIRPAAKQLFRAKSYCSTPTLYDSRELTCRWHQCTSILTRLKPANSIPTIMQSIILVAPFAMDRQVNIQRVEKVFSPRCADFETFLKVSKSCLIERAVGFLPPAHTPRCSVASVFCGVFLQSRAADSRPYLCGVDFSGTYAKTCCFLSARWTKIRAVKCARGVTNQLTG